MQINKYIYNVNYQGTDRGLSELEIESLFDMKLIGKVLITDKKMNPDISPFIKNRLDVMYEKNTFEEIIEIIDKDRIDADKFKVSYLKLMKVDEYHKDRRSYCKEIGLRVTGYPQYVKPVVEFAITFFSGKWYLGVLNENTCDWKKHNDRPYSYSSSLNINIAKALVNIAAKGNKEISIIDPCCGVGTVMFEAFYSGYNICGREINEKVSENARINLKYFDYPPNVDTGDIRDIDRHYDVSIVDLPYGISVEASREYQMMIIRNAKRIADKLVLVTSEDMEDEFSSEDFILTKSCKVTKNKNRDFARYIWIIE